MLPGNNEELAKSKSKSQDFLSEDGRIELMRAEIPIGRLGFPEEIAETVLWMVKTGYVTNKVIGVDGGFFVQ
jgi:3-oxoacyl-[acyl-carrier protein] reductase